jgi:hypothetical protein
MRPALAVDRVDHLWHAVPRGVAGQEMDQDRGHERAGHREERNEPDRGDPDPVERQVLDGVEGSGEGYGADRREGADHGAAEDQVPLAPQADAVEDGGELDAQEACEEGTGVRRLVLDRGRSPVPAGAARALWRGRIRWVSSRLAP